MTQEKKYVERVSSRPYWRTIPARPAKRLPMSRKGVTCSDCDDYPCFRGIDGMSSNLAETCQQFKRRKL